MKRFCLFLLLTSYAMTFANQFNYYLQGELGASFAMKPNFCVNTATSKWDAVTEGYNASLGAAPLVGLGFGFSPSCYPWLALGFSANLRSNFKYCKYQSAGNILQARTAYFNVDNTSYMFNVFFNKASKDPYCSYTFCQVQWMPFAGFGIGLGRNNVFNFHSVKQESTIFQGVAYQDIPTLMTPIVFNRFAWQVQLGILGVIRDSLEMGISYRFFDSGKLETNNYMIELFEATSSHHHVAVPAWRGKFRANELVFHLGIWF